MAGLLFICKAVIAIIITKRHLGRGLSEAKLRVMSCEFWVLSLRQKTQN